MDYDACTEREGGGGSTFKSTLAYLAEEKVKISIFLCT